MAQACHAKNSGSSLAFPWPAVAGECAGSLKVCLCWPSHPQSIARAKTTRGREAKSAQVCSVSCSLSAYDPENGAECRRASLGMDQLCQQSTGFSALMSSQTRVAARCHTASACSALTVTLLTTQLSTPVFLHHSSPFPVSGAADTP